MFMWIYFVYISYKFYCRNILIENYKNISGKMLKQERVIKAPRDTSFCILLPPFTIPLFLTHRKDLVSLIYIFSCREPLSPEALSPSIINTHLSLPLSLSLFHYFLSVESSQLPSWFNCEKGKENKREREEGRFSFSPVCELGL